MTEAEKIEPRYLGKVIGMPVHYPFDAEEIEFIAYKKLSDILTYSQYGRNDFEKFERQIEVHILQNTQHWGNKQDLFLTKLSYEYQKEKEGHFKSLQDIDDQLSGRKPMSPQNQKLMDEIAERRKINQAKIESMISILSVIIFVLIIGTFWLVKTKL